MLFAHLGIQTKPTAIRVLSLALGRPKSAPETARDKLAPMKLVWQLLLSVFLGCAFTVTLPDEGGDSKPPSPATPRVWPRFASDVFLVTIDTLRADHVGCYGDREIQTPTLDGLARDGIRFANAFTPSPITNTSHASILTGLLPSHHGVTDFVAPLAPDTRTLAEIMKEAGFVTAAFIGAVILDSKGLAPGFDRGFDYFDHFPDGLPRTASRYARLERRGMEVTHHAEAWLLKQRAAQRRFAWVHLYDPHDPYDPPPAYRQPYVGHLYYGEIAYADSALGHFVSFLKEQGLYDSSLVIVVGDHGEGLGDHGEQTHGIFLYDATTHVPLILKPPRWAPGQEGPIPGPALVVGAQVRTIDILPTVLELEGIEPAHHLDGVSLKPLWSNRNQGPANPDGASERIALGETDYPLDFGWAPLKSARAAGMKYIEGPRPEFYDLRADPHETKNCYEPWNENVQRLRAMVAELRTSKVPGSSAGVGLQDPSGRVTRKTLDELEALGYLGKNPGSTTAAEPMLLPDPKDRIEAHNFIHDALLAREEGDETAEHQALERAVRADPESAVALTQLGELDLKQGRYKQAVDLLERSRRIRPRDATTVLDEAHALYHSGDLARVRTLLEGSEDVVAGQSDARYLLGQAYAELKDWDKAGDQFEAAILLDPRKEKAYLEYARLLLAQKKPAEALQQLHEAETLVPNSPEVFVLMAEAYSQGGQKAEAQQASERAKMLTSKSRAPHISADSRR